MSSLAKTALRTTMVGIMLAMIAMFAVKSRATIVPETIAEEV